MYIIVYIYTCYIGAQCARALRNLSVNTKNKEAIIELGASEYLSLLIASSNDRVSQQARKALKNIETVHIHNNNEYKK